MFDLDVQSALVWPEAFATPEDDDEERDEEDDDADDDDEDEEDDEDPAEEWHGRELRTLDDVHQLAGELAVVAAERAIPYAKRYADLDRLIARVPGPHWGSVRRAALLAAAGRFDEARASLAVLPAPAWPGLLVRVDRFAAAFLQPLGKHELHAFDQREHQRGTERSAKPCPRATE
jgi:hypothetical protein